MNNKLLTGLEAINLMQEGKLVSIQVDHDKYLVYKLQDGKVYYKNQPSETEKWYECTSFNLSLSYKEYIESEPLAGWERVVKNNSRFSISQSGAVITDEEIGCGVDDLHHSIANYFSTKEKAEEINFKQTLFRKLQRFSDENGGNEINWNSGDQLKYFISFNYNSNAFYIDFQHRFRDFGNVYFISRKVAEQAVDLFHDDLIKYFTM